MALLNDEDIDWIKLLIAKNGITDLDMADSILDHLCCMAESRDINQQQWKPFIEAEIQRMHPISLKNLELEKDIIIDQLKKQTMKKTTLALMASSVTLLVAGTLFKVFHLAGASMIIVLAVGLGSIAALVSMLQQVKNERAALFSLLTILSVSFSLGCLFKIQHWPYANILMLSAVLGISFLYVPLSYVRLRRDGENEPEKVTSLFLLFIASTMTFMLFDLSQL
jgi:hypothetical protein